MPLTITIPNRIMSTAVSGPPRRKPPWNRMSGKLSSPSQMWPRIQKVPRPICQVGTLRRAPRAPAKIISAKPTTPNVSPTALPPLGPFSAWRT